MPQLQAWKQLHADQVLVADAAMTSEVRMRICRFRIGSSPAMHQTFRACTVKAT